MEKTKDMMSNNKAQANKQLLVQSTEAVSLYDMRNDSKRFPRLRTYSREEAVYEMSKIVIQAYIYRGNNADTQSIQFIANALVDELILDQEHLGTMLLSFAEIARVVKRAILSDEIYSISVASLYKAIINYVKGEGHRICKEINEKKRKQQIKLVWQTEIEPLLDAIASDMVERSNVKYIK